MLGLGALSYWLAQRADSERQALQGEIERMATVVADGHQSAQETARLRAQLAAARVALRSAHCRRHGDLPADAAGGGGADAAARGVVYVAADHQHWVFRVDGLVPSSGEQVYRLWFVPAGGDRPAVHGGRSRSTPAPTSSSHRREMPADTKAMFVTLEPAAAAAPRSPTGPVVLYGDHAVQVL